MSTSEPHPIPGGIEGLRYFLGLSPRLRLTHFQAQLTQALNSFLSAKLSSAQERGKPIHLPPSEINTILEAIAEANIADLQLSPVEAFSQALKKSKPAMSRYLEGVVYSARSLHPERDDANYPTLARQAFFEAAHTLSTRDRMRVHLGTLPQDSILSSHINAALESYARGAPSW